jgi:Spy/CpxP family protein refolding chaperone
MDMGGFLMGEMPPTDKRMSVQDKYQPNERVAIGGAPDAVPPVEGHLGTGAAGMGKDGVMCVPGKAMTGCPMMTHKHNWCPLVKLEGQYALTDDQYQKLYDIKGQFISNIVPKGLNAYMLIRKMGEMLTASAPDTKAIKVLEKQIAGNVAELSMTVMDSVVSADQVLTPEQRQELHRKMIRH